MTTRYARNWISYVTDSLVNSQALTAPEAIEYLTQNLFGDAPNTRLHEDKVPHEATARFLHRLYEPLLEAATRDANAPEGTKACIFTDISLISASTVLAVYFSADDHAPQILLLDSVRTWDLVFSNADDFNAWAVERHEKMCSALQTAMAPAMACAVPA